MDSTLIRFSTVEELEDATRGVGSGESVLFKFVGSCTLMEAATIYRRLEGQVASNKGLWKVDDASMDILRRSAQHYEELDLLELSLELMELDLKDSVPMKMVRFDGIRATANAVATTADASNVFALLDDVIIESQRLARVCRGLGFGREDIEVASLKQEDLVWLTADGAGALVLAGDGGEVLADGDSGEVLEDGYGSGGKVLAGLVDGAEVLAGSVDVAEALAGDSSKVLEDGYGGGGKVLADLVDGAEVLAGGKVLAGSVDVAEALAGGNVLAGVGGKEGPLLLADQPLLDDLDVKENLGGDHGDGDASGQPGAWIQFKEETVIALMRFKVRKLRDAIASAKGRVVNP